MRPYVEKAPLRRGSGKPTSRGEDEKGKSGHTERMTCGPGRRRLRDRPRGARRAGGSLEDSPREPREGSGPGQHPDFRLLVPEP